MKTRPILFSAPMVRALLNGSKTQTRRVIKPQPPAHVVDFCTYHNPKGDGVAHFGFDPVARELQEFFAVCPDGQPGDRLWVRETWAKAGGDTGYWHRATDDKADDGESPVSRWKPSIHMPRAASRITLEIAGVRVERLHDISEADAIAEGVDPTAWPEEFRRKSDEARSEYAHLWESIHGQFSWELNPWVWVIEFRRVLP